MIPEVGQLETESEGNFEELPEAGIEALEERLEDIIENDLQLGLLEQIFDPDQESLKFKYSNKNCTWKLVHLRRNLRMVWINTLSLMLIHLRTTLGPVWVNILEKIKVELKSKLKMCT